MLVHPNLLYGDDWSVSPSSVTKSKDKGKGMGTNKSKTKLANDNIISASLREAVSDVIPYVEFEDKEEEIMYSTLTEVPLEVTTWSGNQNLIATTSWSSKTASKVTYQHGH